MTPSRARLRLCFENRLDEWTRIMDERSRGIGGEFARKLYRTALEPSERARVRSRIRVCIGLIVAIGLAFAVYQIGHRVKAKASRDPAQQAGSQSVGAATITQGDIRVLLDGLGIVTPVATVTIQTQISGQLIQVGFREGQIVNKGDFLAQIDDRPYEILKVQYEGQLAQDQGLLGQAQMDLKRYQALAGQNSIARQQAEDQVFIVQQYEGSVKSDQAQIDTQVLNIAYCHIVSPVAGRIGLRLVDPGNYVQTDTTTITSTAANTNASGTVINGLAVITQLQPITVIFAVPEDALPEIVPQLNAGTVFPVTAYDRANIKQLGKGRVTALASQIDPTTGMVKARAQFDNSDNVLFPQEFVHVHLLLETLHDVVTVPTSAIESGPPGKYVYVINPDNTVSARSISVGPTDGALAAVNWGLTAGERVVVEGADRLRDGIHVNTSGVNAK
jgi:membrane fusion protein, multidrug efflux system